MNGRYPRKVIPAKDHLDVKKISWNKNRDTLTRYGDESFEQAKKEISTFT